MNSPLSAFRSRILLPAVACLLLSACGTLPRVTGEPPQIGLDSLARDGSDLTLGVRLRNINDEPFAIRGIAVHLALEEQRVAEITRQRRLTIPPRGRDTLAIDLGAGTEALSLLDELAAGERLNLPWQLQLTLTGENGREHRAEATGYLHPVPGQPGRFR